MKLCKNCILPETFPGLCLNSDGICQYCEEASTVDFAAVRREVESFIHSQMGKSRSYDIVLAFSGGKDSTYTLKYLKEIFNARVIAVTVDNDFISDAAMENCRRVPAALGVDHLFFKPNPRAMMEIYRKSLSDDMHTTGALMRASAVCSSCIQVINTQILNLASNYGVPVIAGGYIGGQIPSETGFMKQSLTVTSRLRSHFMSRLEEHLPPECVRLFVHQVGAQKEITVVNPMVYLNPSEERILEEIRSVGWVRPDDTGAASTNCLLNDYAIHKHIEKLKYHPYVFEMATMVRLGVETRERALNKINQPLNKISFVAIEAKLNRFQET